MVLFLIDHIHRSIFRFGKIYFVKRQGKWDPADTGRIAHSILPKVSLRPCILCIENNGHCAAQSHLAGFRKDHETADHLIWHCERFKIERCHLIDALTALDVQLGTSVQDLCALKKW
jgi:hypothetical protein